MNHPCVQENSIGCLEQVYSFWGAMPTGVSVTENGRLFVCFPEWGDDVRATVCEIRNGELCPYPDCAVNNANADEQSFHFVSVQSIVADGLGTLWILDTAAPNFSVPDLKMAKLVAVDLASNQITRVYGFTGDVVLPTTYLNDVRIDYRTGTRGTAYITDSSLRGPGAVIVLDLDSGKAVRRLNGSPSTSPDPQFIPKVEGTVWRNRSADGTTSPVRIAADGIALSPDGAVLYYCPLSSRHLFAIPTTALRNLTIPDQQLETMICDFGEKGASDGLATDAFGNIYAGDYENNSIRMICPNGTIETIAHAPCILWPDTLSIGADGYLYFISNQLHRQAGYHYGKDCRQKPYSLLRININAKPAPTF